MIVHLVDFFHRITRAAHPEVAAEPRLAAVEARGIGIAYRYTFGAAEVVVVGPCAVHQALVVRLLWVDDVRSGLATEDLEGKVLGVARSAKAIAGRYCFGLG
jgi:hypothetical protein